MIDYHNHTKLCKHAEGEIFQYIEQAIQSGISEIAFTDHNPLPNSFDSVHRMNLEEMDLYMKWILEAQNRYPEIKILLGIEMDYIEGFEEYTSKFLQNYDFDVVIMSVHFIKDWPEGNWIFKYNFPDKTVHDIYSEYLDCVIKGIETGLFDVVGHVDLIKNPGMSFLQIAGEETDQLLRKIKSSGMVLELNTSGLRKKISEPFPGFDWIDQIHKMNIPVCIGSDSHSPSQVGFGFDQVYSFFQKNGIQNISHFEKRKMIQKPLIKSVGLNQVF